MFDMGLGRFRRVVRCATVVTCAKCARGVLRFPTLAAPTRVSPATASQQQQHHKHNQYG